ncbi:MAG: 1-phosphofructokinase, partial [Propionibacteriaceae bacterium]|nr:1-phosphofructokinase [Propionibacteriaceae bacterium]
VAGGVGTVVISLGRDGALLVDADQVLQASANVAHPVSTVGAGDALLAGYLHSVRSGTDAATALRTAVAFGAAAVALPGSEMPGPEPVAAVTVQFVEPDPDRPLDD